MRPRMPRILAILALAAAGLSPSPAQTAATVNLLQFDSACGQPQHNCRDAFQKAFAQLSKTGGVLQLPAGNFLVDFPEVPSDVRSAPQLQRQSLLVVPPNVTIQGQLDAKANPLSVIEWRQSSIPLFVFAGASHSGMKNLHFRFLGTLPQNYPYGDVALLRALGYKPTFPHVDQMSGGNYEMSSVIMLFDSEYCSFDNLTFDSATHDNAHVFGAGINAKGKGIVLSGGAGGLNAQARGNHFTNLHFFDDVMPMVLAAQQDLVVNNISGDRRGSSPDFAPGHLIYFVCNLFFHADGTQTPLPDINVTATNIHEGGETYSNLRAGATLAVKWVHGGTFTNIVSYHPAGLIQTLYNDADLTFQNLTWSSNADVCKGRNFACKLPVIASAGVFSPIDRPNRNLTFRNASFTSTGEPITLDFMGDNIDIDGLTIKTPPDFRQDQKNTNAVLSISDGSHITVSHYTYIPLVASANTQRHYNAPFTCWGKCSDVHSDVHIVWPKSVPVPRAGMAVITSNIQFHHPGDNDDVQTHIEPR